MSTRSQFKPGSDEVMYMRDRLTQEEFLSSIYRVKHTIVK